MSTESLLQEYLAKSRAVAEHVDRSEVVLRVEGVFETLRLPYRRDNDGGWEIASDVGEVMAGLDEDEEVLTFHQMIHPLSKAVAWTPRDA